MILSLTFQHQWVFLWLLYSFPSYTPGKHPASIKPSVIVFVNKTPKMVFWVRSKKWMQDLSKKKKKMFQRTLSLPTNSPSKNWSTLESLFLQHSLSHIYIYIYIYTHTHTHTHTTITRSQKTLPKMITKSLLITWPSFEAGIIAEII